MSTTEQLAAHVAATADHLEAGNAFNVPEVMAHVAKLREAAAALSQPQQPAPAEPIVVIEIKTFEGGTRRMDWSGDDFHWGRLPDGKHPLYAAAAAVQPPVLPLTDKEIDEIAGQRVWTDQSGQTYYNWRSIARAIEAKVRGTGSVPPSANLDVHPAQRSTQGARTEGAD